MDSSDASLDKEYERLNEAIMKAIITSEEIKNLLVEYKSNDMIQHMAVLNLVLSLEELSEVIISESSAYELESLNEKETPPSPENKPNRETGTKFVIDGKNLTHNEILFERFCQGKFDESDWLKKIKIKN